MKWWLRDVFRCAIIAPMPADVDCVAADTLFSMRLYADDGASRWLFHDYAATFSFIFSDADVQTLRRIDVPFQPPTFLIFLLCGFFDAVMMCFASIDVLMADYFSAITL